LMGGENALSCSVDISSKGPDNYAKRPKAQQYFRPVV
jgi:hypothetical protein